MGRIAGGGNVGSGNIGVGNTSSFISGNSSNTGSVVVGAPGTNSSYGVDGVYRATPVGAELGGDGGLGEPGGMGGSPTGLSTIGGGRDVSRTPHYVPSLPYYRVAAGFVSAGEPVMPMLLEDRRSSLVPGFPVIPPPQ